MPSKSNQYIIADNRLIKSKEVRQYELTFARQIVRNGYKCEGPFRVDLAVFVANKRQDLDGVFKVVLDMMQKCELISNDNLCYEIRAFKHIDKINPRIEFKISRL